MILAAGYGTRMRPLSDDLPKAIMPLWNRPLLARNADLLRGWGVREILVNAHHGADQVIREAMALSDASCRVTISHEPDILGTGGALRRAEWFFDDQPFWLINADVVALLDPSPLLRRFKEYLPLAALWMHDALGPRTVEVARGRVTNFQSQRPGTQGTQTFCGLHLMSPRILDYLPDSGFASIITAYEQAMQKGERMEAVSVPDAYWADVGSPERYLQAHAETARYFAPDIRHSTPDTCLSPTARAHPKAGLRNGVVWDGAEIGAGACVENAVVGRGCRVSGDGGRVSGVVVRYPLGLSEAEQRVAARLFSRFGLASASEPHTVNVLPARGSARSFIRVSNGAHSVILMRYDPSRTENTYYVRQTRFLSRHHWPVPELLHAPKQESWAIIEDVGDDSLVVRIKPHGAFGRIQSGAASSSRRTYRRTPKRFAQEVPDITYAITTYRSILDCVLELHGPVTRAFRRSKVPAMPPFGPALYRYERKLFTGHYLRDGLKLDPSAIAKIDRELQRVARELSHTRPVLLHRDLQSSNIFFRSGEPVFIDFQGMRLGPAAYDLASLLCDPYVALPRDMREELLDDYAQRARPETFTVESYRWACIQRLSQAIGAYARLSALPGCERFADHIPAARTLLYEALGELPGLPSLKALPVS